MRVCRIIAPVSSQKWIEYAMDARKYAVILVVCLGLSMEAAPVEASAIRCNPTQSAAANKEVVQRFLAAISAKDAQALRSTLAPSARVVLSIAGVYSPELHAFPEGTQWNREEWIRKELDFQAQLKGSYTLRPLSIISEGDRVAAEAIGRGVRASNERQYLQHYSYQFRIVNGAIAEARVYQDTFHYWDVWNNTGTPPAKAEHKEPAAARVAEGNTRTAPAPSGTSPEAKQTASKQTAEETVATNKQVVLRYLRSVPGRDPEAARESWVADGVWSFALGGDYLPEQRTFEGAPHWDRERMISMQQDHQAQLNEPFTLDVYSLIGEGSRVSGEAMGFMVRGNGRAYRQHYSFHFELKDGKLIEGHVYQDTLHQYDLGLEHERYAPVAAPIPH
jgi:ketosteroid isomerase-like protein